MVADKQQRQPTEDEIAEEAIYRQRMQDRLDTTRTELKILRKKVAKRDELFDRFAAVARAMPPLRATPPPATTKQESPATLHATISDVHAGKLFDKVRGGGLGQYDLDVFRNYAQRYTHKLLHLTEDLRRGRTVDHLIVDLCGDLIDGHDIFPGHDHEAVGIAEQLAVCPEVISQDILVPLARHFHQVHLFVEPGNHGRLGRKGLLDRVHDSLDVAVYKIMQARCREIPNLIFHPSETWFNSYRIYGHHFLSFHGDTIKGWAGIPFYGATRMKNRMSSLLHTPIDVMVIGHFHTGAEIGEGWGEVVMNGSWVGTDEFSSTLGLGGPPMQKVILITPDRPVDSTFTIHLATREELLVHEPVELVAKPEKAA